MWKIFTKEIVKSHPIPEYIIFNVDNFNNWFNDKNNKAVYANSGIFLRLDKLSQSHIEDYIEKCYGIDIKKFTWSEHPERLTMGFYEQIRDNWVQLIHKNN